jgi:hypothetical protein
MGETKNRSEIKRGIKNLIGDSRIHVGELARMAGEARRSLPAAAGRWSSAETVRLCPHAAVLC